MEQLPEHQDEISEPEGSGEEDYEVLERLKTDLQKIEIKMIKREKFLRPPPRKEYELARCDDEYLGLFKEWTLLRRKVHSIEGQKETEIEGLEIDLNEVRIKMICKEKELGLSDNPNLYNLARTDDQYFGFYEQELQLKEMIKQKRVHGRHLALPSDGAQFDAYAQHSPAAMARDLVRLLHDHRG
jgi:hypothetical protein